MGRRTFTLEEYRAAQPKQIRGLLQRIGITRVGRILVDTRRWSTRIYAIPDGIDRVIRAGNDGVFETVVEAMPGEFDLASIERWGIGSDMRVLVNAHPQAARSPNFLGVVNAVAEALVEAGRDDIILMPSMRDLVFSIVEDGVVIPVTFDSSSRPSVARLFGNRGVILGAATRLLFGAHDGGGYEFLPVLPFSGNIHFITRVTDDRVAVTTDDRVIAVDLSPVENGLPAQIITSQSRQIGRHDGEQREEYFGRLGGDGSVVLTVRQETQSCRTVIFSPEGDDPMAKVTRALRRIPVAAEPVDAGVTTEKGDN